MGRNVCNISNKELFITNKGFWIKKTTYSPIEWWEEISIGRQLIEEASDQEVGEPVSDCIAERENVAERLGI